MTIKQCNSCKYLHIWKKKPKDTCHIQSHYFMGSKNCLFYEQGNFEEIRKEYKTKYNKELP